jgi:hypothetical protein
MFQVNRQVSALRREPNRRGKEHAGAADGNDRHGQGERHPGGRGGNPTIGRLPASFKPIVRLVATTLEAAREIELSAKPQASTVEQGNVASANVAHATTEPEASSTQTRQTATLLAGLSKQSIQRVAQP